MLKTKEDSKKIQNNISTSRDVNFDLMRIIIMIMIMIMHYFSAAGINTFIVNNIINDVFMWYVESLCFVSVNVFVITSGYYLIYKEFKLYKVFELWFMTIFYSVGLYMITVLCGINTLSISGLFLSFTPITHNSYWYITCYLFLYILFPTLNKFIASLSKKEHFYVICLLVGIYGILPGVIFYKDYLLVANGYSLPWFISLYILGAFLRKNPLKFIRKSNLFRNYFIISLILMLSHYVVQALSLTILNENHGYLFFKYISLLVIPNSIVFFLIFLKTSINNKVAKRIITFFSPLTFGVYLIHMNPSIYKFLWFNILNVRNNVNTYKFIAIFSIQIFLLYCLCSFIEFLRQKIFEKLLINKVVMNFSVRVEKGVLNLISKIFAYWEKNNDRTVSKS